MPWIIQTTPSFGQIESVAINNSVVMDLFGQVCTRILRVRGRSAEPAARRDFIVGANRSKGGKGFVCHERTA